LNADIPVLNILSVGEAGNYVGGSGMGTARIFINDVPQNTVMPHIVVEQFDAEAFDTKDGVSYVDHELVKVYCYGEGNTGVRDSKILARAVRNTLDAYQHTTIGGEEVEYIRYQRQASYNIQYTNKRVYVREQDYQVRIKN
jgi:hypothetical protein